jgi:competence protein ComEA
MKRPIYPALFLLAAVPAFSQDLPDGPGKTETQKICSQCHELARATSLRQDNAGWTAEVQKMISLGAKGSNEDFAHITAYLSANFPADEVPKIHINSARAIELESGLTLRRSESAAIIAYREKHGDFKSFDDLKNIPGFDFARIESKKDRITFN